MNQHQKEDGSIRIAMFDMTNNLMMITILAALQRGIKMYIVLDENQFRNANIAKSERKRMKTRNNENKTTDICSNISTVIYT